MKKIIKTINEDKGMVQVTTTNERWYTKTVKDKEGIPFTKFVPSVTWICNSYPKSIPFYKWLASKGWDEAEAIKTERGKEGSKIHFGIEDLLNGKEIKMTDKYLNTIKNTDEELTLEEYEALMSFKDWHDSITLKLIATEFTVFSEIYNCAGTVDLLGILNDELWILDWKSSKSIWPSFELQESAYKQGIKEDKELVSKIKELGFNIDDAKLGILQVGYSMNKKRYKFTEVKDKFDVFLATKKIWENDHGNELPKQRDYPTSIKLSTG